jgi:hypothetical protein
VSRLTKLYQDIYQSLSTCLLESLLLNRLQYHDAIIIQASSPQSIYTILIRSSLPASAKLLYQTKSDPFIITTRREST